MCNELLTAETIKHHLLFGTLHCEECQWVAADCQSFANRYHQNFSENICQHNKLRWDHEDFIKHICQLRKTSSGDEFVKLLTNYEKFTAGVQYYSPYQDACHFFRVYKTKRLKDTKHINRKMLNSSAKTFSNVGVTEHNDSYYDVNSSGDNSARVPLVENNIVCNPTSSTQNDKNEAEGNRLHTDLYSKITWVDSNFVKPVKSPGRKHKNGILVKSLHDKHNKMEFGPLKKWDKNNAKVLSNTKHECIPSYARDNFVLSYKVRDFCNQCWADLEPSKAVFNCKTSLIIAQCKECRIYNCIKICEESSKKKSKTIK